MTACPFDGGATSFLPPVLAHGPDGPLVHALALIGRHVLVFTQRR